MQRVDHPDGVKANAQALDDLENGAGGLCIVNGDADVGRVLQGVALHAIHTRLEGGDGLAKAFAAYVGKQPIDPARLNVSFGMGDVEELVAQGFKGPFLEADGRVFHEQGASEVQELACVLAQIVGALRKFEHLSPENVWRYSCRQSGYVPDPGKIPRHPLALGAGSGGKRNCASAVAPAWRNLAADDGAA